jgi:GH35 family endo-1,4-beta-xylanase
MKIFYKKALLLLVVGLFFIDAQVFAQNLALNPGFEEGTGDTYTSWVLNNNASAFTATTVPAEVRSGARAMKVVNNIVDPSNQYRTQTSSALVDTPIGSRYRFSFWIKAATPGGFVRLTTVSPLNNYSQYSYSANLAVGTDWQQVSFESNPAVETQTQFQINLAIAANTYFVDDVEVTQISGPTVTPPTSSVNLLNPSFELGTGDVFTNWTKQNGAESLVQSTTEFHEGARSLRANVTVPGPEAYKVQLVSDPVETVIGNSYTFKIWVKAANADNTGPIRISTNPFPDPTADYSGDYNVTTGWTQLTWVFTARKSTTSMVLDLGKSVNTYYFDDITLSAPIVEKVCLIKNVGFDMGDGFTDWSKFNGAADMSITTVADEIKSGTNALKAVIPATADAEYKVQLVSSEATTVSGVNYKFTIYSKRAPSSTSATSTIRFSTEGASAQYSQNFVPGSDWTLHSWTFRANTAITRIALDLGGSGAGVATYFLDDACLEVVCDNSYAIPTTQVPMATGKSKYFGNIWSGAQVIDANKYFNQVIPENAGKWGLVETSKDVFNWSELDAARKYADDNGFIFRFHVLLWGSQQPEWLKPMSNAEKLVQIKEWFTAVRDRYNQPSGPFKKPDYIEVFNETMNDPPNNLDNRIGSYDWRPNNITDPTSGDYLEALRSLNTEYGTTPGPYDYVINAFKLAREIFGCDSKLVINDYAIESIPEVMAIYTGVVNDLKADNLVDAVGMQLHTFNTQLYNAYTPANIAANNANLLTNLNTLASTGLPIMVTEMDIDGDVSLDASLNRTTTGTQAEKEAFQKSEYERVFPIYWNHPSVIGVTLWGYRTGHWRTAQQAYLIDVCTGAPKPAMTFLQSYISGSNPAAPVATPVYACPENVIKGKINNGATATSNGTPLNGDGTSLYVKLVQGTDVKHVSKVGADGSFTLFKVTDGIYDVKLSKNFDQNATSTSLPTGLSFSKEGLSDGTNSVFDAVVDGVLKVNIVAGDVTLVATATRANAAAPAFTPGDIAFALAGAPLPVDLISFDATNSDNAIILNWKTANEKGFSHFEVQKSLNSKEFNTIDIVNGTSKTNYSTIDSDPKAGINYYRLKMVDLDGTSKLSSVIGVKFDKNADYILVQNPAQDGEIKITSNLKDANFTLLNTSGASIQTTVTQLSNNTYSIKVGKNTNPGIYFLKASSNGKVITNKILMY